MGYSNPSPIVENAFMIGSAKKYGNMQTDGKILLLFGNRIAEHREDGVYITNCNYFTATTKAHLNLLPNVRIHQAKKIWYLNGNEWDGKWIKISDEVVEQKAKDSSVFDTTTEWVATNGWRGYNKPKFAVFGANDTGAWEDSPCPSDVCESELKLAIESLGDIPHKIMTTESSNVFCVHRYVIVPPSFLEAAKERFAAAFETLKGSTRLLYEA